jgi:hypothetical protein
MRKDTMVRWRKSGEEGTAVIEFALVLPILVMLVFGIFQFGVFYNRQQLFHSAAREGARLGAIPTSTVDEIDLRAREALNGNPLLDVATITITPNGGSGSRPCEGRTGESVIVQIQAPTTIEIPMIGDQDLRITGRGEFRCE